MDGAQDTAGRARGARAVRGRRTSGGDGPLPGGERERLGGALLELLDEDRLRDLADEGVDQLAVLEEQERGQRLDAVAARDVRLLLYVDLADDRLARPLAGDTVEDRR